MGVSHLQLSECVCAPQPRNLHISTAEIISSSTLLGNHRIQREAPPPSSTHSNSQLLGHHGKHRRLQRASDDAQHDDRRYIIFNELRLTSYLLTHYTQAAQQSQGIQTLLEAEKEAAKIVQKARTCKCQPHFNAVTYDLVVAAIATSIGIFIVDKILTLP